MSTRVSRNKKNITSLSILPFLFSIIKTNYVIIIIFVLLIAFRFIWIDKFPPGMQYDEVEYSLSGKTYQMMEADLSGVSFPKSLITTNTLGKISPVPYMILSPIWNFISLNTANFRSLYVILNVITAMVFMLFLHYLFKKKNITLLGGILFLVNPWSFFLSRHGMDGPFALLFYLLGTVFLLKDYSRKNITFAFSFFFLGCFSYHGAKPYLIPLVLILSIYIILTKKISGKKILPYILLILSITITLGIFVIGGKLISGSIINERSQEFVFTNMDTFSGLVNSIRTASIQSPLQNLIVNKGVYAGQYFINNYLEVFSPTLLFLKGEVLNFHGFFYIFEAVFLLTGFVALFNKNRPVFWLITALIAIIPITTATSLSGFSVINRAIMLLPMLLVYITYGLYSIYEWFDNYIPGKLVAFFIGLLYFSAFMYFQYIYFFIFPVQLNMHYQTNMRIMARYLSFEKQLSNKIVVVTPKPQVLFSDILFYLPRDEQETILRQKQTFGNNSAFTIGNITFTLDCISQFDPNNTYIIDHDKDLCYQKIPFNFLIINQIDAGVDFSIVGGKACKGYKLNRWHYPDLLSDYNIETMSKGQFCQRWIAAPTSASP